MEITKEYLDEQFSKLATKEDIENLAAMVQRGFDDVDKRLDVRSKVEELEQQMHEVRAQINLA